MHTNEEDAGFLGHSKEYHQNIDACQFIWEDVRVPLTKLLAVRDITDPGRGSLAPAALDSDAAEKLARSLKAIADPARLRLVSIIAAQDGAEVCNCDLTEPLGLGQPTVSHHLKVLVDAGILSREKRGTWAYYRVIPGALDALAQRIGAARL